MRKENSKMLFKFFKRKEKDENFSFFFFQKKKKNDEKRSKIKLEIKCTKKMFF